MQIILLKIWKETLKLSVIVSDTSCLIFLNKIEKLPLLKEMFGEVFITDIVFEEYGEALPDYIKIKRVNDKSKFKFIEENLGKGELSAIALSLENSGSILILDDRKARGFAKRLGITVIGVLGLLLVAKEEKRIEEVKPCLTKLRESGMWVTDKLFEDTLRKADEI